MDAQALVDLYGAELKGQQVLFPNPELVLRRTKFKPIDPKTDQEACVQWWMYVYVPDGFGETRTEQPVYNSWSNALSSTFRYTSAEGYLLETHQAGIRLACYRKDPVEDHVAELNLWLPHIKPITKERRDRDLRAPAKHISIFEHTLSASGVYSLLVFGEDDCEVQRVTYGHMTVLKQAKSLAEAVAYVHDRHYYEKGHHYRSPGYVHGEEEVDEDERSPWDDDE